MAAAHDEKAAAPAVAPAANGAPAPSTTPREVVKVNNANLTELKNACDDALKRYLSRPDLYKQDYTHTDVRLALGWLSVFCAGGTGYYGWKVDFEESKPLVWAGVLLYVLLTTAQTLYAYFVEKDVVFVGKRKSLDKRIITERLTVSSSTDPKKAPAGEAPAYALAASLVRTSSGGKSLLARTRHTQARAYSAFFDADGVLDQDAFEAWVAELVAQAAAKADA